MLTNKSMPKLLFISPHPPLYDKSSGDFRLYKLLEILSRSHDINFVALNGSDYGEQEDQRYLSMLTKLNITTYLKNFSLPMLLFKNKYKASILEFYYTAEHYLPRIKLLQPSCPVIIDSVDVHYRRALLKYSITKEPDDLIIANKVKTKELEIYEKADMVITVTEEDSDFLHLDSKNLRSRTIPNIHELNPRREIRKSHDLLFVGGFSHDPNVDAVIYFCKEIFPLIKESVPETKFTIAGSNPPDRIQKLGNDSITVTGYVPSLEPLLHNSYISVAPLRYGAGMKGKIGEAMAHGLPVVTTSIGAQGMGLVHRFNSMIADSPDDFAASVIELFHCQELYDFIRYNAMEHIKNTCTPEMLDIKINGILAELENIGVKHMNGFDTFRFIGSIFKYKLHKDINT